MKEKAWEKRAMRVTEEVAEKALNREESTNFGEGLKHTLGKKSVTLSEKGRRQGEGKKEVGGKRSSFEEGAGII